MKRFLVLFLFLTLIQLFLPKSALAACDYPSLCDTQGHATDPNPGQNCTINGVTTDPITRKTWKYHYGTSNACGWFGPNSCTPRCGFLGTGFCCDPDNKSDVPPPSPTGFTAPPCNFANGACASVNTALGPIQTDVAGLTKNLFSILLGFAGGAAILLIIAAGYQLMTSQGNPEKVKEGRERIIAAIVGLLFIIFSVTILQIIGVDILQIPGFSR